MAPDGVASAAPPEEPAKANVGRVVVVASTKGGVGRTTVSTNLAAALHASGRRVCLVDLDLECGDVALSLGITPVRTLLDAVEAAIPEDIADPLELLKTEFRSGLDCILAPVDPEAARKVPASLVADLLPALAETYDYVVVDTSAHQSPHVRAALRAAGKVLLVGTADVLNVKSLHLLTDLLDGLGVTAGRDLVVNRDPDGDSTAVGLAGDELVAAVDLRVAMWLPESDAVQRALLKGTPLVLENPGHPFSAAFHSLVAAWNGTPGAAGTTDRRRKRRGLRKGKST